MCTREVVMQMHQKASLSHSLATGLRRYRATFLFLPLMFMCRSAWADWMTVPRGSMNPTIIEGDRSLVDKHVFGLRLPWTLIRLTDGRDPQRGEIVVFDPPNEGPTLVKRVAGVP